MQRGELACPRFIPLPELRNSEAVRIYTESYTLFRLFAQLYAPQRHKYCHPLLLTFLHVYGSINIQFHNLYEAFRKGRNSVAEGVTLSGVRKDED